MIIASYLLTSLILPLTFLFVGYKLPKLGRKETKLVIYVHDHFKGPQASALTVAGRAGPDSSIMHFGSLAVVDDLVTEGPDPGSRAVGRAQGVYVNSQLDGMALYMAFSVIFTEEGKFKGSTLEIQGADPFEQKEREFSVVSGTGFFRFANGYGVMETEFIDVVNLQGILKLSITVRHG